MNTLETTDLKYIAIGLFANIIETYMPKNNYTFQEVKSFLINLLETQNLYLILSNILVNYNKDISPTSILDIVFDDLDMFVIDLISFLNNKQDYPFLYVVYTDLYHVADFSNLVDSNIEDIVDTGGSVEVEQYFPNIHDLRFRAIIHMHMAKKAGKHYDLRIEVAKNKVVSVAFRYNPLEKNKSMGIIQPIHTSDWMEFEGKIEKGYGAGYVEIVTKGLADIHITENETPILLFYDIFNDKKYAFAIIKNNKERILLVKTEKIGIDKLPKKDIIQLLS